MNKEFWIFTGIAALVSAAFPLVEARGALQDGLGGINLFLMLSLFIPIVLKKVRRLEFVDKVGINLWCHAYSWLFWTVLFYFGGAPLLNVQLESPLAIAGVWFLVMVLSVVIMEVSALALTRFFKRKKRSLWLDSTLDIAVLTLPVPITLMGHVLFLDLQNPVIASLVGAGALAMLQIYYLLLVILTMLVLVFYWYPRDMVAKFPTMVRIFLTGFMWLAINGHVLFGGYMPEWVLALIPRIMPVFQGNTIVYITPLIFEFLVIAISVGIGVGVEKLILRRKNA